LAPQPLGAGRVGVPDRPVVVAIRGRIAPPVAGRERPRRQPGGRTLDAIGPVEDAGETPAPDRRCTVPLALARAAPAATKCAGENQAAKLNDPPRRGGREAPDKGSPSPASGGGRADQRTHAWGHFSASIRRPGLYFTHKSDARLVVSWKQSV